KNEDQAQNKSNNDRDEYLHLFDHLIEYFFFLSFFDQPVVFDHLANGNPENKSNDEQHAANGHVVRFQRDQKKVFQS
ncbi:hypothetical protein, partial [Nitrospina gracilis]|uniref:hypothetical protein n=1 Tax=Nitrospina gracilis TaxID=35801 RepID=UPI001C9D758D